MIKYLLTLFLSIQLKINNYTFIKLCDTFLKHNIPKYKLIACVNTHHE